MPTTINPSIVNNIKWLKELRGAFALVWESARALTVAGLALMVIQGFLPLLTLYLIKLTVDAVAAGIQAPEKEQALREVFFLIMATGLATLMTEGLRWLAEVLKEHQSQRVTDHVMDVIQRKSAVVDLAYYDDPGYHDTLHRAQQEAPFRPTRIVQTLSGLFRSSLSLTALAGLLLYFHWAVAVVLFIAVTPGIVLKIRYSERLYKWQTSRTKIERLAHEFHRMLTDSRHPKELRLFGLGDVFRGKHRALRDKLRLEKLRIARSRSVANFIAQIGAVASIFGMLAFIAWRTIMGAMTLGDMVMYYQAFQRAQTYRHEIMTGLAGLYGDSLFLKHFNFFMKINPTVTSPEKPLAVPRRMKKGIEVEAVSFSYPAREKAVLRNVRLTIRPGEVVALVGENGSGKTTLAKLLCRLYDATGGRITMDGADFRDLDLTQLRKQMSLLQKSQIPSPRHASRRLSENYQLP